MDIISIFFSINYKYNCIIFSFSTDSIITHESSSNADLCKRRGDSGVETCPVFNTSASTFYIRVHAFKNHQSGNLKITGSNLLSIIVTGSSLDQTTTASTSLESCKHLRIPCILINLIASISTHFWRSSIMRSNHWMLVLIICLGQKDKKPFLFAPNILSWHFIAE